MPYVDPNIRGNLEPISDMPAASTGELTFQITRLCEQVLDEQSPHNFQVFSSIIAALECAKLEFYRRVLAPYEDMKIRDNGDVYANRSEA
jgi:hypothetical protein